MKVKSLISACLSVMFVLSLSAATAGAAEQGRIPPNVKKYPTKGSVEQTTSRWHTIYTKDSSGKVIDYYRKALNMNPAEEGKFLLGTDATFKGKEGHMDAPLWLKVSSQKRGLEDKDLFGFLHQEVIVKKIHSQQELEQVKVKYSHLADAWYPKVDARAKLKSCSEAMRANVSAKKSKVPRRNKKQEQEMLERMQQLMAQGRHQEAAMIGQQAARPGMEVSNAIQQENKTDHWNEWLVCLDDLDRYDFRTKIEIELYESYFKPTNEAGSQGGQEGGSGTGGVKKKLKGVKKFFKF